MGVDRISQLPDHIIHQILSSLPTREVVRTCTLSPRWRDLWASMPHLRFSKGEEEGFDMYRFIGIVLLLHEASNLQTFQLAYSGDCDEVVVHQWIRFAVRRGVQELDISLPRSIQWPTCIFTLQSLITLRLDGHEDLPAPSTINLSKLRKLQLRYVFFNGDDFNMLIQGCPVLEQLDLESCGFEGLDISSDKLRTLNLIECYGDYLAEISVSAPGLLSFKLVGGSAKKCRMMNLSSMVSAYIDIEYLENYGLLMMFDGLRYVRNLELGSGALLEHLLLEIGSLDQKPKFLNLKNLKLNIRPNELIQTIPSLLQCSPNLENLSFEAS